MGDAFSVPFILSWQSYASMTPDKSFSNRPVPSCSKGGYRYPPDRESAIGFPDTYPLDSDLSGPSCSKAG